MQTRSGNLKRRTRAAGLNSGDPTEQRSIDDFRMAITRRILMVLNHTEGCRRSICKRHRGCMASGGVCGGLRDEPGRVIADDKYLRFVHGLRQQLAAASARKAEDETRALPAPFVPTKAAAVGARFKNKPRAKASNAVPSPHVGEGIRSASRAKKG